MEVGSADYAWSNYLPPNMEVGSADYAWSNFQPVHPWTVLLIV